jgi:hypothetical protein
MLSKRWKDCVNSLSSLRDRNKACSHKQMPVSSRALRPGRPTSTATVTSVRSDHQFARFKNQNPQWSFLLCQSIRLDSSKQNRSHIGRHSRKTKTPRLDLQETVLLLQNRIVVFRKAKRIVSVVGAKGQVDLIASKTSQALS